MHTREYTRILRNLTHIKPAITRYRALFSPLVLSDYACTEILSPQLQALPCRADYYTNLENLGKSLLEIHLNDFLGTQNVEISEPVLDQYAASNRLSELLLYTQGINYTPKPNETHKLIEHTLAAVHLGLGSHAAQQVAKHICGGTHGLANAYIYSW